MRFKGGSLRAALSPLCALAISNTLFAADPQTQALDLGALVAQMGGGSPIAPPGAEKELPDYAEVTKGMAKKEGLLILWQYPADAKDKDRERLLCEVPVKFLGEKFMLSTSVAGGPFFYGFPLDERVAQWKVQGKQLVLVEPQTRFVVGGTASVQRAVERSYPERIRAAVPIVTKAADGSPVINLGDLLKSEFADVSWMAFSPFAKVNPGLSEWTRVKAFPLNVEIGVSLALNRMSPPLSFDKRAVHFSFWKLPASDYKPREADDRVGYFLTSNRDWSKPLSARDLYNRYIDRWHLVKRDPTLARCEPKQPITFYIEQTVPVQFRRAVRDGILEWNKAFDAIGFVNAVEVRQQEADNEWADLDPEDMRYSFFRWIVTGGGFAMGPHRANPFTGQIWDADIVFDDSMVRFFEEEAERLLPSAMIAGRMQDEGLRSFLARYPEWLPPHGREWLYSGTADVGENPAAALARYRESRGFACCDYMQGMHRQMSLAATVLADSPDAVKEQFLYDIVKEVVMHEVGHTLGLRHNFKASSVYSLAEIRARKATGEATSGSVMDYHPALFLADGSKDGHFITPTIGPYDKWAIEYGYKPYEDPAMMPGKIPDGQQAGVAKTADAVPAHADVVAVQAGDLPPGFAEALAGMPADAQQQLTELVKAKLQKDGTKPSEPGSESGNKGEGAPLPLRGEAKMLKTIASRASERELAYATDEDTTFFGMDPLSHRFDVGSDPLEWAADRIALVNGRLEKILEWSVKDGESWYHARNAFYSLLFEKAFVLDYVGSFVGGQYFNRSHRGDPNAAEPYVLVEPARQRQALTFLEEQLFSDRFFTVDAKTLRHMAPPRWMHSDAWVNLDLEVPMHELIGTLQWWNLFDRLFPPRIQRIHDAELKAGGDDKLTAAEYIQRIQGACWGKTLDANRAKGGTWTEAAPYISDITRSLQREYLGLMEPLVRYQPGDVISEDLHAMVRQSLLDLIAKIGAVSAGANLDFASRAHLTDCWSRIELMLKPELDEYQGQRFQSSWYISSSQPSRDGKVGSAPPIGKR